jgi:3-hydroxyisobutyrate dehydrogenase
MDIGFIGLGHHGRKPCCPTYSEQLAEKGIGMLDCPVSGGVRGATAGTLAMMVSGPRAEFEAARDVLETLGRPIFVSEKPGAAQTTKLVDNLMAATAEAVMLGVKAGLAAEVVIDVLNAGSRGTHIADAVAAVWEMTLTEQGAEPDFTSVIKPIEEAGGVVVGRDPC